MIHMIHIVLRKSFSHPTDDEYIQICSVFAKQQSGETVLTRLCTLGIKTRENHLSLFQNLCEHHDVDFNITDNASHIHSFLFLFHDNCTPWEIVRHCDINWYVLCSWHQNDDTPLSLLMKSDRLNHWGYSMMRLLYVNGSSVRPQNLFESIVAGDHNVFQQITKETIENEVLNRKDRDRFTPLGSALYFNEAEMVKKLIQLGCDLHLKFTVYVCVVCL